MFRVAVVIIYKYIKINWYSGFFFVPHNYLGSSSSHNSPEIRIWSIASWIAKYVCRFFTRIHMTHLFMFSGLLLWHWDTWWRHQTEAFSALLALCAGNSTVPVNSPHKGQWRGALMFSLICARINNWVNNREAGDLRRHRGHYDVSVMNISQIEGILPKGPYLPCVSMAGRALLTGYHRNDLKANG